MQAFLDTDIIVVKVCFCMWFGSKPITKFLKTTTTQRMKCSVKKEVLKLIECQT